jgi:hypothetical protein
LGIIIVKIYQRLNSRQHMNRFVNQLVNATIWIIIDKLYDARQFYRPLFDNFCNILVLRGNEESTLMNRYLLSLQGLQSALFEQHSEYYLEELLKTMLAFTRLLYIISGNRKLQYVQLYIGLIVSSIV